MQYNIHPMVVHFPIALLLVYSVIKILPLKKWISSINWKDTSRVLLFFGVVGAFVSISTGELAEHLVRPEHKLVETHAFFANLSTWLYGMLLVGELSGYIATWKLMPIKGFWIFLERLLSKSWLSGILAFVGILAISITGLLGGVMVYGLSADPVAPFVLELLGIVL